MLGIHVNQGKSVRIETKIKRTYELAQNDFGLDMGAAQIFVVNPRSALKNTKLDKPLSSELGPRHFYAHSSYTTPIKNGAYQIKGIAHQMQRCNDLGIRGLVVHLTAVPPENVNTVVANVMAKLDPTIKTTLYLEQVVPAKKEYAYTKPKDINALMKYVTKKNPGRKIGFCLDTCHMWANGLDISTYNKASEFLGALDPNINFLAHLNDCELPLGIARDRHACIGANIWKPPYDESGLMAFLEFFRDKKIDYILERNEKHSFTQDLSILAKL